MTDPVHVQVTGLKRTVRQLKKLNVDVVVEVKALNKETAALVAQDAMSRAPRKTGRLAGSIRPGATQSSGVVRAGSSSVPYAAPIHWGWPSHDIKPQPFLYEALDARRPEVIATYEKRINELVRTTVSGEGPD